MVKRFEVYLISLDPSQGKERKKTRPCVVLSPDELNVLHTYIVAPMTTKAKAYPTRVPLTFDGKNGYIVLDQIRTIDHTRLLRKLGNIDHGTAVLALQTLREVFEY